MAIPQKYLLSYANKSIITESIEHFSKRASSGIMAFLCHSHLDSKLAEGVQKLFVAKGVDIYIDWQDAEMPPVPNIETAQNIKHRIRSSQLFFFLATENSVKSRWCPWEIGIADSMAKKIYIIPTQDANRETHGNEYLQLYNRVDIGTRESDEGVDYGIFSPHGGKGIIISTEAFR